MTDTTPDFSGKVLALTTGSDGEGLVLASPRWERQEGRLFLVGIVPPQAGIWASGATGAVAWDAVLDYLVFDSAEAYAKSAARHRPSLRERLLG